MALKKETKMTFGEHSKVENLIKSPSNKTKRIQVIMDDDLHREFKMACMRKGVTISEVMIQSILNWMDSNKI